MVSFSFTDLTLIDVLVWHNKPEFDVVEQELMGTLCGLLRVHRSQINIVGFRISCVRLLLALSLQAAVALIQLSLSESGRGLLSDLKVGKIMPLGQLFVINVDSSPALTAMTEEEALEQSKHNRCFLTTGDSFVIFRQ